MSNKETSGTNLSEDDIVKLLATLRMEPHPEANFEDRFVHDFRDRVARYAVTRPARKVLWEHIMLRLTGIGKLKLACGATTLGVGVLAAGFLSLPSDDAIENQRLTPTIGSARVVSKADSSYLDKQSVVVSSSLELESATCILPTQNDDFFVLNGRLPVSGDMNYNMLSPELNVRGAFESASGVGSSQITSPSVVIPHSVKPQHITLPVGNSESSVLPSLF